MRISDWSSDVCSSDLDARRRPWVLPTHQRHFVILGAAAVKGQHEEGAENPEQDIDGERRGPFHRRVFSLQISTISTSTIGFLPVQSVATRRTPRRLASRSASRLRSRARSEEHTSELQSLMRSSYAVFCLKKKHTSIALNYQNLTALHTLQLYITENSNRTHGKHTAHQESPPTKQTYIIIKPQYSLIHK